MIRALCACIRVYQRTLSPDSGWLRFLFPCGVCRFFPTCSTYMLEALTMYGLFRGGLLGIRRILRCHPYAPGGEDPLPLSRGVAHEYPHIHRSCTVPVLHRLRP